MMTTSQKCIYHKAYHGKNHISFRRGPFQLVQFAQRADDGFKTEGLELHRFLWRADESGDLKGVSIGMLKETGHN